MGKRAREGSSIINDSRGARSAGGKEGEIWRGGNAHHGGQTMCAKLSDLLIGQLLPAGFLSDMAKISHARAVAAKFHIRRKRQSRLNEDLVKTLFLGGRARRIMRPLSRAMAWADVMPAAIPLAAASSLTSDTIPFSVASSTTTAGPRTSCQRKAAWRRNRGRKMQPNMAFSPHADFWKTSSSGAVPRSKTCT